MIYNNLYQLVCGVFQGNAKNIIKNKIQSERDWQVSIYCDLKSALEGTDIEIYLDDGVAKGIDNCVWVSPKKYQAKEKILNELTEVSKDVTGYYKINFNRLNSLPAETRAFIKAESCRSFYVDITLRIGKKYLVLIELKYGANIESDVDSDYHKLVRMHSLMGDDISIIAAGYSTRSEHLYWKPINQNESYNVYPKVNPPKEIPKSEVPQKLIEETITQITVELFCKDNYISEFTYCGELKYAFHKIFPEYYSVHAEISDLQDKRGRIDLGIYIREKISYLFELKGHYECPFPIELLNGLANNKELQSRFYQEAAEYYDSINEDADIKNRISLYPRIDESAYYINKDFFEKITELYYQYNRLLDLSERHNAESYLVFLDHNDDYSIRKKHYNVSEDVFIENFNFRKELIERIIGYSAAGRCRFLYFYKLNSKNGKICKLI
jgi:hypothetical protein